MKTEIFNKAVALQNKKKIVEAAIKILENDGVIWLGDRYRMDEDMDIHDVLKDALLTHLNIIKDETETEFRKL